MGFTKGNKDEVISTGVFDDMNKESIEKAEEYLDKLEGVIELEEESNDIVEIFKDKEGIEGKIHDTLIHHLYYWGKTGASDFALSVIRNRYVGQLKENRGRYEEPNNMSYKKKREWAKIAVEKLKEAKLVADIRRGICGVLIH